MWELTESHAVMQVENKKNHVILYLQNISQKKRKEITFSVQQDFVVTHPKPAPVQIYDYYETGPGKDHFTLLITVGVCDVV
ncbi:ovostatin-like [Limosa lapponica baueri]|uniref:Ovostatin-like n=1 Tax=Limosa lapponica baueri TaxID=1758121 RepID=A0A2I0T6L0_LIMLA|nr:ovostatin-like [Limosa lapponica baueri]